jgi:16S rRNA (guanine527-N7)-methyltransferase
MAEASPPARPDAPGQDHLPPGADRAGQTGPGGIEALWANLGWHPDDQQQGQFLLLQEQLRHWNARVNLTRLVEGDDYWIAQVFDSLWPLLGLLNGVHSGLGGEVEAGQTAPLEVIDVGTGGGFPGLAVAIALPSARLTLVDSVGRKVEAVRAMVAALGLEERVKLRCERIERTGRGADCRGRFDWAVARAVAGAPVVAEYLVPLLNRDGRALLYRGRWGAADQLALERAAGTLRAEVEAVERTDLPAGRGLRHAVILRSVAPCPQAYPRPVGVPLKLPIDRG